MANLPAAPALTLADGPDSIAAKIRSYDPDMWTALEDVARATGSEPAAIILEALTRCDLMVAYIAGRFACRAGH